MARILITLTVLLALPVLPRVSAREIPAAAWAEQVSRRAPSIVSLRYVLRRQVTRGGQTTDQERNREARGVLVGKAGLVMTAASNFGGRRGGRGRRPAAQVEATPTEIRVVFGNEEEEHEAALVARDSDLGLAFVQILDLAGREVTPVDLAAPGDIRIGQEVFTVSRLPQGFDCAPTVHRLFVAARVEKPRPMWAVLGAFPDAGLPVFDASGAPVGILSRQRSVDGGPGGSIPAILPLPTVARALAAAQNRSSPEALALLAEAIAHQGPEKYAAPGAIENISVKIAAQAYDYSRDPPDRVSVDVSRYLTTDPVRFRSEWKTAAGVDIYGNDGKRYWSASYDTNGSLVDCRFLFGDDDALTRQKIDDEIAETRSLLRLFFLANQRGPGSTFRLGEDETVEVFRREVSCRVLRRTSQEDPPLTCWLDRATKDLVKAVSHAEREGEKTVTFLFRYEEDEQPRVKGVLFPLKIEIREQAFGAEKDRPIYSATLHEKNGVAFNTSLAPALFKRPK